MTEREVFEAEVATALVEWHELRAEQNRLNTVLIATMGQVADAEARLAELAQVLADR
jgi:hypothetical protein